MAERGYCEYANGKTVYMKEDITVIKRGDLPYWWYEDKAARGYYDEAKRLCKVFIPNSVICLDYEAFLRAEPLVEVCFEDYSRLTYIGEKAFSRCRSLKKFDFAPLDSLRWIGDLAFENTGLESIDLRESSASVGRGAFANNEDLLTVFWNYSDEIIQEGCFSGCSNLLSITGADRVRYVGCDAFKDCTSLVKTDLDFSNCYIEEEGNDPILKLRKR